MFSVVIWALLWATIFAPPEPRWVASVDPLQPLPLRCVVSKVRFPICAEQVCEGARWQVCTTVIGLVSRNVNRKTRREAAAWILTLPCSNPVRAGLADREPNPGYGEDEAEASKKTHRKRAECIIYPVLRRQLRCYRYPYSLWMGSQGATKTKVIAMADIQWSCARCAQSGIPCSCISAWRMAIRFQNPQRGETWLEAQKRQGWESWLVCSQDSR